MDGCTEALRPRLWETGYVLCALSSLQGGDRADVERIAECALVPNPQNKTLLHEAAVGNHSSLLAALIPVLPQHALGLQDSRGRTPALAAAAGARPLKRRKRVLLQLLRAMSVEQICVKDSFGKSVAHYCARSVRGRASVAAFGALLEVLPFEALTDHTTKGGSVPSCLFKVQTRYDAHVREAAALLFQRVPHLADCIDPCTGDSLLVRAADAGHAMCLQLLIGLAKEETILARGRRNQSLLGSFGGLEGPPEVLEDIAESLPVSLLSPPRLSLPEIHVVWVCPPMTNILLRRIPDAVLHEASQTSPDERRRSLLITACWGGSMSTIALLTERLGAAAWAQQSWHGTPLHVSLRSRVVSRELVEMWNAALDAFPEEGLGIHNGMCLLHIAVANPMVPPAFVDRLIDCSPADVFTAQDTAGNSPLHCALQRGTLEVVERVVALSPPEVFMIACHQGMTPITRALMCTRPEAAELVFGAAPYEALTFPTGLFKNTPLHHIMSRMPVYFKEQIETLVRFAPHALRETNSHAKQPWELLAVSPFNEELAEFLTPRICVKSAQV